MKISSQPTLMHCIYTSVNLVPNAQVCVYLMVHITKLQQKKNSHTLKKDHQITHMKIICTTVEETHTIYGQANF